LPANQPEPLPMATTTGTILARLGFSTTNTISTGNATTAPDGISIPINVDIPGNLSTTIANGTTAGTVNVGWADTRTLTATSVTLDLTALTAAATNTGAAAFAAVVALLIKN